MWLQVLWSFVDQFMWQVNQAGRRFLAEDEGASMVEYAILVALIAIAAVQSLGNGIAQVFQNILGRIQGLGR
mgnify:CR=1 FL=1